MIVVTMHILRLLIITLHGATHDQYSTVYWRTPCDTAHRLLRWHFRRKKTFVSLNCEECQRMKNTQSLITSACSLIVLTSDPIFYSHILLNCTKQAMIYGIDSSMYNNVVMYGQFRHGMIYWQMAMVTLRRTPRSWKRNIRLGSRHEPIIDFINV